MNDQLKFLDPEEMVSCPYEIAHTCPRKRLAFHLVKCRKQHVELAKELRECIHNIQHKIPRPEYEVSAFFMLQRLRLTCIHDEQFFSSTILKRARTEKTIIRHNIKLAKWRMNRCQHC